jgi:hypothetical protein
MITDYNERQSAVIRNPSLILDTISINKHQVIRRENMYIKLFVVAFTIAIVIGGCSKNSTSPIDTTPLPQATLSVSPSDGQTAVRLDAAIALTFAKPVDRAIVERNLHLISQRAMPDSVCPDSTMMTHGGMTGVMGDSTIMRHLGQVHAMRGRYTWNGDSTMCIFRPDSMMTPRTQYMIHLGREIMQMLERRVGDMTMMGGHGRGLMSNDMMYHFVTMDTTGGGHGHH